MVTLTDVNVHPVAQVDSIVLFEEHEVVGLCNEMLSVVK